MSQNKNNKINKKTDGPEEIIERLDSSNFIDDSLEFQFDENDDEVLSSRDLDRLFEDDKRELDHSADMLFNEDRRNLKEGLKEEIEKALSQPEMSKASLYRMRTAEPSEEALTRELAKIKTVEEAWEESEDNTQESQNRKSIIVMCFFIALAAMAGGWALWKSTNDERGNEDVIVEKKKEFIEKEKEKKITDKEVEGVSNLLHQYFSALTVEQKCSYIYNADVYKDKIIEYYDENGGVKPLEDYFLYLILPTHIDGEEIWEVSVKKNQEGIDNINTYYVRKNLDDEFKVDWFSEVALQENDILEFKESRSKSPTEFKFKVQKLNDIPTYNWGFRDTEYQVVKLTEPNTDLVFWGYLKLGSSAHTDMNRYLGMDIKNRIIDVEFIHEFILVVRFLKDSPRENDQYIVIEDVISRRWFTPSTTGNTDK